MHTMLSRVIRWSNVNSIFACVYIKGNRLERSFLNRLVDAKCECLGWVWLSDWCSLESTSEWNDIEKCLWIKSTFFRNQCMTSTRVSPVTSSFNLSPCQRRAQQSNILPVRIRLSLWSVVLICEWEPTSRAIVLARYSCIDEECRSVRSLFG